MKAHRNYYLLSLLSFVVLTTSAFGHYTHYHTRPMFADEIKKDPTRYNSLNRISDKYDEMADLFHRIPQTHPQWHYYQQLMIEGDDTYFEYKYEFKKFKNNRTSDKRLDVYISGKEFLKRYDSFKKRYSLSFSHEKSLSTR